MAPGATCGPRRGGLGHSGGSAHGCGRHSQDHRCALEQETGPQREALAAPAAVLEVHDLHAPDLLDPDDRATPAGLDILHHQPQIGLDLMGPSGLCDAPVTGERIDAVTILHRGIVDLALDIPECQRAVGRYRVTWA